MSAFDFKLSTQERCKIKMLEFNATFFVAMFSFIIFMLIMNSILYKPLSKIIEQRENIINNNYADTQTTNERIKDLENQHRENIEETKLIAREQFNQKLNNYKAQKDNIIESAKSIAKKDLAIAQAELAGDAKTAKVVLKSKILSLASLVTSKILNEKVEITEVDEDALNIYLD